MYKTLVNLCSSLLILLITRGLSQEQYPRPTFPDVFQTEIEGTFIEADGVVEIDVSMYYDRTNNRAALSIKKEGEVRRLVYHFNKDEMFAIDSNECEVREISDEQGFFPFTMEKGKKRLSSAEETFFFTKSEMERPSLNQDVIPTLVYKSHIDIPRYGVTNCDILHIFSKLDMELSRCREGIYCNSTLITISAQCKNEEDKLVLDHVYRFYRFIFEIQDETVFQPPAGIHCDLKSQEVLRFPPYFSLTFDIIEKPEDTQDKSEVFNTHKQVWYDSEYRIIRIDEFDYSGLLYSSRIFDFKAGITFTIIPTFPTCDVSPVSNSVKLDEITRLPKSFFYQNESKAVYVGKRKVHGLDSDVWSHMFVDKESDARVVEEVYILQIVPSKEMSSTKTENEPHPYISHVNTHTYEMKSDLSFEYELVLLKVISINNFKTYPKDFAAFDVSACFSNNQMIVFAMKIKGSSIVKGSQFYKEVLEHLYRNIIAATGVSVVRIGELGGIFDGIHLLEVRGSILDNSESAGWPKNKEPGMEEAFKLIQKAASENKLSFTFIGKNKEKNKIDVISVEEVRVPFQKYPRPTFPDVFQTQIEGTFKEDGNVVEIQASMFYDRTNNRASLFIIREGKLRKLVYNFDNDETFSIDSNECEVREISDEQVFFPFAMVNGKKRLSSAEEAFFFTKSETDGQLSKEDAIPTLVYKAHIDIPQYGQANCDVLHIFSIPDMEIANCGELNCNSTLTTISVQCNNEGGKLDHVYRFSLFTSEIQDETVFLPPPGIYCDLKSSKEILHFPPYFSFTFDIIEKPEDIQDKSEVFNTHKEVWYDSEYKIIRIDEFDYSGLLHSSRIFDIKAGVAFTIIASVPTCDVGPISNSVKLDEITRLPKSFFYQNESKAVYVGKRNVHGLDYDVWSRMWSDKDSESRTVEEIYILEIVPNNKIIHEPYHYISHVDMYTYEMKSDSSLEYELVLLKYFSINNFRLNPKEWAAFDVSTCFSNNQMIVFAMKVKGPSIVKGSQSYREILQHLYDKIIGVTDVSVVRISELTGIFDGIHLLEVRGSILDNSESAGWPKNSGEPGMEETFKLIQKAVTQNKLSVTFTGENDKENKIDVISVEKVRVPSNSGNNCYPGASLAAASLVLLLMGIFFGVAGYYVFLKKRKSDANIHVRMSEIDISHES